MQRTRARHEEEQSSLRQHLLANDEHCNQLMLEVIDTTVTTLKKAWEIQWEDIDLQQEIGSGAFGIVHAGSWRDLRVAVKLVRTLFGGGVEGGAVTNPFSAEVDKEVAMLQTVRHPNIVLFFGAGTRPDGAPFLVTELMELGTLTRVLRERAGLGWDQKCSFALDTARGMAHVHSLGRMHRDLKSGNLLVSPALQVKVADFGTAALASLTAEAHDGGAVAAGATGLSSTVLDGLATQGLRTRGVGTPLWMAPEVLEGRAYSFPADVYSFGIVMWEIAAQALPWAEVPSSSFMMNNMLQLLLAEQRPVCNQAWPEPYCGLMQRCWRTTASNRPDFPTTVTELLLARNTIRHRSSSHSVSD